MEASSQNASPVKPAPRMLAPPPGLPRPSARFHDGRADVARYPDPTIYCVQ